MTAWLGLGAATFGMGAALSGGIATAHADSGTTDDTSAARSAPDSQSRPTATARARSGNPNINRAPKLSGISGASGIPGVSRIGVPSAAATRVGNSSSEQGRVSNTDGPAPAASETTAAPRLTAGRAGLGTAAPAAATPAENQAQAAYVAPISAASTAGTCTDCWGIGAPNIAQGLTTAVNHLFNSAFTILGGSPSNAISAFIEGALVLVRRTLFFIPTGVSANQTGTELSVDVGSGSVAYFRQSGSDIQVSDNPLFWGASNFEASSVSTVAVGNSGTTGCAGLWFTAGSVAADLTTTEIDSLRFDAGANFTGSVNAVNTTGPIALTGAVRGLNGVAIDGDVILNSNVEIDAGNRDAVFTGTVDGKSSGSQSLMVTALGDTTFQAAVGGQTPLASLLTRAIAPIEITQSADSKTIPLHYMPTFSADGNPQVKYGIDVAIGGNAPRTYLFDTGGNGFYAGYTPSYWQDVQLGTNFSDITYTSGNFVNAVATTTTVTIGTGSQSVTTQPIQIGAILAGGNPNTGTVFDFSDPTATPWDGRFVGDFGASFGVQAVDNQEQGLTSVLWQLPGNLSSGFLAQLGPIGSSPQLTMGVTDALRSQFPYAIPVSALIDGGVYPVSGYPVLQQFGFSPQYVVTDPNTGLSYTLGTEDFEQCAQQCLPSLIDSGAPSMSVRLPHAPKPFPLATPNNSALTPGSILLAEMPTTQGRLPLKWTFVAGTNGSVNQVGYDDKSGSATTTQNVNTGLNLYNDFDVMFDIANQVIWLRPNGGQSTVSLQSVTTIGAQTYSQNAILNGSYSTQDAAFSVAGVAKLAGTQTVIGTNNADVTFSGTLDGTTSGDQSLTVYSRGKTNFVRQVGNLVALSSITTDTAGSTLTAGVTTTQGQQYSDNVSLNGAYRASTFTASNSTTLTGPVSVTTPAGSITFNGKVDSDIQRLASDTGTVDVKTGFTLAVSAQDGQVKFGNTIGSTSALGGLIIDKNTTVTAIGSTVLDGGLNNSGSAGITIGDGATVQFTAGGSITGFSTSGIVFEGSSQSSTIQNFQINSNVYDGIQLAVDEASAGAPVNFSGTVIAGNTIYGNSAFGIEAAAPVMGLTVRNNIIGQQGETNEWGYYITPGPNTHGIVLAPGQYSGTTIYNNTIADNLRSGIAASGGVQGLLISNNTIEGNQLHGIEFATGDFDATVIYSNTITANGSDGVSLGAGIGQGQSTGGDPLSGYTAPTGHYEVQYANNPNFYDNSTPPADPQIQMRIGDAPHGTTTLTVNLDTGSRGLYFDALQLPDDVTSQGTQLGTGYVYLNSSNRLFFGDWVQLPITLTESAYVDSNGVDSSRQAQASVPILVVSAVGASNTPSPGSTVANTTFGTTVSSGYITITDGTQTQQAAIVTTGSTGLVKGSVTIPGGWWANYADNIVDGHELLAPVANFGIGFDRSGQGTAPTTNESNQSYNAFLNLTEMQDGTMRPGYVLSATGVQLGLDDTVDGFAYTNLTPSGLEQGDQSAPDWQPATGTITYNDSTYNTGQVVIDMGIPSSILTLPGQSPTSTFSGTMTVNLLNSGTSGPGVNYSFHTEADGTIDRTDNLLAPTNVAFFNPLAGSYTENMPAQSQQFFNTGRDVFAAFDYLYDAAGGYFGLKVGSTPEAQSAFEGNGEFTADYYANPNTPTGVNNLTITNNTIAANNGAGISVVGSNNAITTNTINDNLHEGVVIQHESSVGNSIMTNAIYRNATAGISLLDGANGGQPAPTNVTASLVDSQTKIRVEGTVTAVGSYTGPFQVQVFTSPASDSSNVQGRQYLGSFTTSSGHFSQEFLAQSGDTWITVTATPVTAPNNTSEFSTPAEVA